MLLINWGGDAIGAMGKAWAEPFMKANPGLTVKLDGAGQMLVVNGGQYFAA